MSTYSGKAETSEAASTFADQMAERAKATVDPVEAMTMRVASAMMAVLPKHASKASEVETLMLAIPSICISIVETVAATAYQNDKTKTEQATLVLLQRAVAGYEQRHGSTRIYVQSN